MFERFTEEARQVVVLAQEEARESFSHNYIGTEHLLCGLLRLPSVASTALEAMGIALDGVREDIVRIVGRGEEPSEGQIPFTPRAKKVLELALREALSLGHNYIGPEHILLGLTRENEGVASRILLDRGADAEKIRNQVIGVLSGPGQPRAVAGGAMVAPRRSIDPAWLGDLTNLLDRLGHDIRRELGRDPDVGDLLLVLACSGETTAGRAIAELGVDLDALQDAVERIRQTRAAVRSEALEEIRRRLGLPEPGGPGREGSL